MFGVDDSIYVCATAGGIITRLALYLGVGIHAMTIRDFILYNFTLSISEFILGFLLRIKRMANKPCRVMTIPIIYLSGSMFGKILLIKLMTEKNIVGEIQSIKNSLYDKNSSLLTLSFFAFFIYLS
jgi:hypothetical protein